MKKTVLFILALLLCASLFGQTKYRYTIKIDSTTSYNKDAVVWMKGMFGVDPIYNDSTGCFILNTSFDISEDLFRQKSTDRNYNILIFNKSEISIKDAKKED